MALTTAARVKGALRIPAAVTVHDARIGEIVEEIDAWLLGEVDLTAFGATTYSATLDGEQLGTGRTFVTPKFPLLSVAALTVDTRALVDGTGYTWERSGVVHLLDPAVQGLANIAITYTAGLFPAGATTTDLVRLATLAAARQYNQEPMAGLADLDIAPVKKGIARDAFNEDAVRGEISRILSRYRKPAG